MSKLAKFCRKYGEVTGIMESITDYEVYLGRGYKVRCRVGNSLIYILVYKDNHIIARFEEADNIVFPLSDTLEVETIKDLEELEGLYTNIYTLLGYLYTEYENKVMYEYRRLE